MRRAARLGWLHAARRRGITAAREGRANHQCHENVTIMPGYKYDHILCKYGIFVSRACGDHHRHPASPRIVMMLGGSSDRVVRALISCPYLPSRSPSPTRADLVAYSAWLTLAHLASHSTRRLCHTASFEKDEQICFEMQ
eukprot:6037750-Pleurochrysis_carterae.AAC.2